MTIDSVAASEQKSASMQIRLTLDGAACVWTGTGFVTATTAVLEGAADSAPYLHAVLPRLAAKHRDLLLALGVRTPSVAADGFMWLSIAIEHCDVVNVWTVIYSDPLSLRCQRKPVTRAQAGPDANLSTLVSGCVVSCIHLLLIFGGLVHPRSRKRLERHSAHMACAECTGIWAQTSFRSTNCKLP